MKRKWFKSLVVVCACLGILTMAGVKYQEQKLADSLSDKILRFHVLANSDEPKDQELKLQVRDEIGICMEEKLKNVSNIDESKEIVEKDLMEICQRAQKVVEQAGYTYEVTASVTKVDFPKKTYGEFTFPAGEYQALQVVIGQGKGKNWWCVMYPNMCFFNSAYEIVEEEAEENLKQVLTTEEYKAIMENKDYQVKFKWFSFLGK